MKGTYCLIIEVSKDTKIKIGKILGEILFKKGIYVYVGSAMNSLESRLKRHLSDNKKKHWHIDYLLLNKNSKIINILFNTTEDKIECRIAEFLQNNSINKIKRFGCSDCRCESHLIYFKNQEKAEKTIKKFYNNLNIDFLSLY